MASIQHHFYSSALTECNSMSVVIPLENDSKSVYPVLWLMSPLGADYTAWGRHTDLEKLANERGIMIVVPDMKLSFGVDMLHGLNYNAMLVEELPQIISGCYPADISCQMIAGVSEGAYIAMMASLIKPKQYCKTLAFSCGSLSDVDISSEMEQPFFCAFGTKEPQSLSDSKYDLKHLIRSGTELDFSGWKIIWSSSDFYNLSCESLATLLPECCEVSQEIKPFDWADWYKLLRIYLE